MFIDILIYHIQNSYEAFLFDTIHSSQMNNIISVWLPNLYVVDLPARHPQNFTQYSQKLDK